MGVGGGWNLITLELLFIPAAAAVAKDDDVVAGCRDFNSHDVVFADDNIHIHVTTQTEVHTVQGSETRVILKKPTGFWE